MLRDRATEWAPFAWKKDIGIYRRWVVGGLIGRLVRPNCHPTVRQADIDIPRLLRAGPNVGTSIPAPAGLGPKGAANSQPWLTLSAHYARRRRRIFGYVGDIHLETGARGTSTPSHLQVVTTPLALWRRPRLLGSILNPPRGAPALYPRRCPSFQPPELFGAWEVGASERFSSDRVKLMRRIL